MTTPWLHEQFAAAARATPAAVAVVCGERRLSYAELDQLATATAARMAAAGVGKGDMVALYFAPSAEQIVCMLAVMRCGAAWVPLDPAWPAHRLTNVLTRTQPHLLVCGNDLTIPAGSATAVHYRDLPAVAAAVVSDPQLAAADLCYVMFTSGSTGQPNGVQVSHGNVAGLLANVRDELDIRPGESWSAMHSAAFGFSLWETWGALSTGGTLVIIPAAERADPWAWDRRIREQRVSVLSLTPSGLRQWLAAGCKPPGSALRMVVLSGEPLGHAEAARWFDWCSNSAPRLINSYALTETAGRVALAEVRPGEPAALLGRPAPDAELLLLDPHSHRPVTAGKVGEIFIAGPMVARGYLDNEELTAARFVQVDPGDGRQRLCYRSGDRAMQLTDGRLQFAGRNDAQVKLRGHRIEPADIETALQEHPRVQTAAVVPVDAGDGVRLHAFAVPAAAKQGVEFWPSLGEYQIYDELLYDFMSSDQVRVDSYRQAFAQCAAGKVVLDIGTGKDALLARLALQAGARHVYAVEVLPDAAASAAALIERLGLQHRITVLCGDMENIGEAEIAQPVELCTQGIVGNIGSSDGIATIWNRARRLFAPQALAVPARCTTFFAPAALPAAAREQPAFGPLAADYTRRVFAAAGKAFDVRLCVRDFPRDALLAEAAVFEELDFSTALPTDYCDEMNFTITTTGWLDGYVLWTRLENHDGNPVDFFDHQQAWLPVWFPVGAEPLWVERGDRLTVRRSCNTPAGQIFPDYRVDTVRRNGADIAALSYCSRHHESSHGETALHRSLLASLDQPADGLDEAALKNWLAERVPGYMVPAHIDWLARLPLNSSSKLDRNELQQRALQQRRQTDAVEAVEPKFDDPLEQRIAELWGDVLQLNSVAADSDFFAAGGDSIAAVRLTTEVQRLLDDTVFLAGLFEAPTVRGYAGWLREHHEQSVAVWLDKRADAHAAPEVAANIEPAGPAPLSAAQQSLYFLQQLYPDNTAANEQFLLRLHRVDVARLRAAWRALIARHDILSVSIADAAMQAPDAAARARMAEIADVLDLSASADAEADLLRLAAAEINRGFDLAAGGLLRPVLVQQGPHDWVLLVTAHHIVADGLCVPLIRDELFALYEQHSLPPPALQFADYARDQQQQLDAGWLESELGWWRSQLAGATLEPVATTRPQAASSGPERRFSFTIEPRTAQALRDLARAQGASLFVTLLTVWRVWLARCFQREDFLLGSPVTQRSTAATRQMLGCLVNNLAFRNRLDFAAGFATALADERRQVLAALDHSVLPFEKIVEDLQPERVFGRHPLFQFMFQFDERAADRRGTDSEIFAVDVLPADRASYWDLELSVTDLGESRPLRCFLGVRDDLFDAAALSGWTEGLGEFMRAVSRDPQAPLAELPLLSEQQLATRAARQRTAMPVPESALFELFARQAELAPAAVAVREGEQHCTYADLLQRALVCATQLQTAGITAGDCVGVFLPRGINAVTLLLAVNYCGAHWLALDPAYPPQRLAGMLAEIKPALLVTGMDAPDFARDVPDCRVLSWQELQQQPCHKPTAAAVANILCIQFTSGSTGTPKGVCLAQRAAVSRCLWMWQQYQFGVAPRQEVFAQRSSLNFVDAIWEIFGALLHGGCVAIAPPAAQQDMLLQARWIAQQGVSHAVVFPSAVPMLVAGWREQVPTYLHTLILTGEVLTPAALIELHQALPHCRLLNAYGTSENWDIAVAAYPAAGGGHSELSQATGPLPVGRPVANTVVHIWDRNRQPLPDGVIGQLGVGGIGVGSGYINRPELTAERFVAAPDDADGQVFLTGDLGSFAANGELLLHGRADRQIKLRGVRVEAGEIEALTNRHPDAQQSAVVLQGAQQEQAWLTLYVVAPTRLHDPAAFAAELRALLSAALPASVVPAETVLVDAIPRTPSGKIDAAALQQAAPLTRHAEAPAGRTESMLCDIWAEALGVAQVGRHDNFFALRGNSLLATRVTALMCDAFNLDLPLACLFESPTVAELARVVEVMQWAAQDDDAAGGEREVVQL